MPKKAADEKVQATEVKPEVKPDVVEVKLAADYPVGTHTVYTRKARVEFVDGTAEVTPEVADELRKLGVIK